MIGKSGNRSSEKVMLNQKHVGERSAERCAEDAEQGAKYSLGDRLN